MKYLVTSEEMKKYDTNTIERIGIPGMVLMERAALAVLNQIENDADIQKRIMANRFEKGNACIRVLVLVGMGNNGGDGLAIARLMSERGYSVDVWCVGNAENASAQWRQQREILRNYAVAVGTKVPDKEYTILVDALFGVGLSRNVEGIYAEAIESFNQKEGYKISVDVPSGLDTDTGNVLGCAMKADMTVTFGFCKRGLVLYPGCEYAGKVVTADIGISARSFFGEEPKMFCYDEEVCELMPVRDSSGNKGTFGKVLLVAGSVNMAGAAILAARATYRAGAGMVKVITPLENRVIIQETIPEALLGSAEDLEDSLAWADVILIGPGIGQNKVAEKCLHTVITKSNLPLLIDADGLNLLAADTKLQQALHLRKGDTILTPHVGELARLTGKSVALLKEKLPLYAMELAEHLHVVVVAKDARTFVCKENNPICVSIKGNSGMATAGSGDVLSGIIAALLAQGMRSFEASGIGVYAHACAGDLGAAEIGEYALMAGDIAEKISALR